MLLVALSLITKIASCSLPGNMPPPDVLFSINRSTCSQPLPEEALYLTCRAAVLAEEAARRQLLDLEADVGSRLEHLDKEHDDMKGQVEEVQASVQIMHVSRMVIQLVAATQTG